APEAAPAAVEIESHPASRIPHPAAHISHPAPPGAAYEDVPLTQIRKTIAKRLVASLGPIPHYFLTAEVDMERAAEAREALNRQLGEQGKLSFNDIIIKATALALTKHRACNAWFQEDHIRYWNEVHIGMAVAVEDGLITPVIRNADRKPLAEIGREARALAEQARTRRLHRRHVLRVEPRHVRHRPVHGRDQPARGRHPRGGLDRAQAGGGGRPGRRATPDARHAELRPPGDRRGDGGRVSADAEADAG